MVDVRENPNHIFLVVSMVPVGVIEDFPLAFGEVDVIHVSVGDVQKILLVNIEPNENLVMDGILRGILRIMLPKIQVEKDRIDHYFLNLC